MKGRKNGEAPICPDGHWAKILLSINANIEDYVAHNRALSEIFHSIVWRQIPRPFEMCLLSGKRDV
jgi:hypothetical protein